MAIERGTTGEGKAALLILQSWRDPANKDIQAAFVGDVLLFDAYVRAAAAGHTKALSGRDDPLQKKLDPIIASMREIEF